jgi:putative PIN family toxin of toxin-antitoxin system
VIVVLDTNVFVQMFGTRSPFVALQRAMLDGRLTVAYSTGMLLEYEEVVTRYAGALRWERLWQVMQFTTQIHHTIRHIEPSYQWQLVPVDPDDNKFVDCAIAAEAEWIITEDRHYGVLKESGHKPRVIAPEAFIREVLPTLQ